MNFYFSLELNFVFLFFCFFLGGVHQDYQLLTFHKIWPKFKMHEILMPTWEVQYTKQYTKLWF